MEDGKYVEQFKTLDDIRVVIDRLIEQHRNVKIGKELGVMFRVKVPPHSSTLYDDTVELPYKVVKGVRVGD